MINDKTSLYLGKLVMKNYKAYRDDVEIVMSRDPSRTITIIHGEMGRGKTTLLEAVYWCLYGIDREEGRSETDEIILNNDVLHNLSVGDSAEVHVEIYLYEQEDLRYVIKRIVKFTKDSESDRLRSNPTVGGRIPFGIKIDESIEYREKPREDGEWVAIVDLVAANERISTIFPQTLASYFLFDAELLDNFFSTSGEDNVKKGIEGISGLPLIKDTINDLRKVADQLVDSTKSVSLEPIKTRRSHLIKSDKAYVEKLESITVELKKNTKEIQGMRSYLRNYNEGMASEIEKRRDILVQQKNNAQQRYNDHSKDMKDWLLEANIIHLLGDSMKESLELCNGWEKEGKIPIAVSKRTLHNILSETPPVCICGSSLGEGSDGRMYIEKLIQKSMAESPVIEHIAIGRGHWGDMADMLESGEKELYNRQNARHEITLDLEKAISGIKDCDANRQRCNIDEIHKISYRLNELESRNNTLIGERALYYEKKRKNKLELEEANKQLDMELRKESKYNSTLNQINLARKIADILNDVNARLIHDMRTTVAKHTTEYFLRLVSKKNDFLEVKIEQDYSTVVLGKDGKTKRLSAGQSCCLALSYIAAIRHIAEKNYFMFIDSPFHNISQAERVDIAKNLPNFIPGTQITLLVQDQEYTGMSKKEIHGDDIPSVRDTMIGGKSVWGEYLLKSQKNDGDLSEHTMVEKVDVEQ